MGIVALILSIINLGLAILLMFAVSSHRRTIAKMGLVQMIQEKRLWNLDNGNYQFNSFEEEMNDLINKAIKKKKEELEIN